MTAFARHKYLGPVIAANRRLVVGATILSAIAIIEGLLAFGGRFA
ncbi:hypothetical protein [Sphingomonas sp. R86521]